MSLLFEPIRFFFRAIFGCLLAAIFGFGLFMLWFWKWILGADEGGDWGMV